VVSTAYLDADGDPLPETLELRPARLKWLIIFLISAGFVSIAIVVGDTMPTWQRFACGGFFALCGLIATPQMIGVGAGLSLDREGFTCRTLFRSFRRRWVDCTEFTPVRVGFNAMVGFSTASDEAMHPRLAAAARGLTGAAGALPDTYGVSADDLADTMNRFRDRALGLMETR
jgi:hypothetical protein